MMIPFIVLMATVVLVYGEWKHTKGHNEGVSFGKRIGKVEARLEYTDAVFGKHLCLCYLKEKITKAKAAIESARELNMSNYTHDEVRELNDAMIEAWQILDEKQIEND